MVRWAFFLLCLTILSGCASFSTSGEGEPAKSSDVLEGVQQPSSGSTLGTVADIVLFVPENVIWWPYKIVSSMFVGMYRFVQDDFAHAPNTFMAVIFTPFAPIYGIPVGFYNGLVLDPYLIRSNSHFVDSLDDPWTQWWRFRLWNK